MNSPCGAWLTHTKIGLFQSMSGGLAEMKFDPILSDWVSRHTRVALKSGGMNGPVRVKGSTYARYTHENGDNADMIIFESEEISVITRPLFGHPTGVEYAV